MNRRPIAWATGTVLALAGGVAGTAGLAGDPGTIRDLSAGYLACLSTAGYCAYLAWRHPRPAGPHDPGDGGRGDGGRDDPAGPDPEDHPVDVEPAARDDFALWADELSTAAPDHHPTPMPGGRS